MPLFRSEGGSGVTALGAILLRPMIDVMDKKQTPNHVPKQPATKLKNSTKDMPGLAEMEIRGSKGTVRATIRFVPSMALLEDLVME